jgi:hypothetical protein
LPAREHRLQVIAGATIVALAVVSAPAAAQLPSSALAVEVDGQWAQWWTSAAAPVRWRAPHATLSRALVWHDASPGVSLAELRMAGTGEAWRLRIIIARIDPHRVALRPVFGGNDSTLRGKWTVRDAGDVLLAVNAGQFTGLGPWGWVVRDGRELQTPGNGPLSSAFVVDTGGAVRLVSADSLSVVRQRGVVHAFQSYPTLLHGDGEIPRALKAEGRGVNLRHRDSRLSICILRDSTLLLVLTRFEGLGGTLDVLPFGLTTPETAALMGALGCARAMLLDGGISGQLAVKDSSGAMKQWPGLRSVPMGLLGTRR